MCLAGEPFDNKSPWGSLLGFFAGCRKCSLSQSHCESEGPEELPGACLCPVMLKGRVEDETTMPFDSALLEDSQGRYFRTLTYRQSGTLEYLKS
jgi:hypothetical protein